LRSLVIVMKCQQCQELISDYIDGLLEMGEQLKVERHISECEGCRAVRDDLLQIVHFSRRLPLHDPSSAVWANIRSSIETEGQLSSVSRRATRLWAATRRTALGASGPWAGVAAVAAIILSVTMVLVQSRSGGAKLSSENALSPASAPAADPGTNIKEMEQRISQLNADIEQRRPQWDPELRTAFDRDMLYVDETLVRCHHEVSDNPSDDVCREMMLGAYREKVRVMEGFTNF